MAMMFPSSHMLVLIGSPCCVATSCPSPPSETVLNRLQNVAGIVADTVRVMQVWEISRVD